MGKTVVTSVIPSGVELTLSGEHPPDALLAREHVSGVGFPGQRSLQVPNFLGRAYLTQVAPSLNDRYLLSLSPVLGVITWRP